MHGDGEKLWIMSRRIICSMLYFLIYQLVQGPFQKGVMNLFCKDIIYIT